MKSLMKMYQMYYIAESHYFGVKVMSFKSVGQTVLQVLRESGNEQMCFERKQISLTILGCIQVV